jgi:RNA polymerase subunit RPABC4/transcription elongation factor Spt4
MEYCKKCGNVIEIEDMFCQGCGASRVNNSVNAFCVKCSGAVDKDDMFCNSCGADTSFSENNNPTNERFSNPNLSPVPIFRQDVQIDSYSPHAPTAYQTVQIKSEANVGDVVFKGVWGLIKAVIVIIIIIVIAIYGIPIISQQVDIAQVRNGHLLLYSMDVSVGEAFDNFFDNGSWSAYRSDGNTYVVFTGRYTFWGDRYEAKITFRTRTTSDWFTPYSLELNGVEQSDIMMISLLTLVYFDY